MKFESLPKLNVKMETQTERERHTQLERREPIWPAIEWMNGWMVESLDCLDYRWDEWAQSCQWRLLAVSLLLHHWRRQEGAVAANGREEKREKRKGAGWVMKVHVGNTRERDMKWNETRSRRWKERNNYIITARNNYIFPLPLSLSLSFVLPVETQSCNHDTNYPPARLGSTRLGHWSLPSPRFVRISPIEERFTKISRQTEKDDDEEDDKSINLVIPTRFRQ